MNNDIRTHRRVIDTLTGPSERRLLRWLAAHMPAWINPDTLTGIGILGGVVILLGYALSNLNPGFLWLASLGFLINWFGDSLDGTLARYRKIERPTYGFYIDHAVDVYNEILIFVGMGISPYVRLDIALFALVGYLLLSVLVFVRTCVRGEFVISYGLLGPTEARMIAIIANTLVWLVGNPQIPLFSVKLGLYNWIGIGATLLMFGIALATTFRQARLLANADAEHLKAVQSRNAKPHPQPQQKLEG
jgi:archaetidylinositol phosphate synthase